MFGDTFTTETLVQSAQVAVIARLAISKFARIALAILRITEVFTAGITVRAILRCSFTSGYTIAVEANIVGSAGVVVIAGIAFSNRIDTLSSRRIALVQRTRITIGAGDSL